MNTKIKITPAINMTGLFIKIQSGLVCVISPLVVNANRNCYK